MLLVSKRPRQQRMELICYTMYFFALNLNLKLKVWIRSESSQKYWFLKKNPFPLFFLSLKTCGTDIAHLSNPSDNNSTYSKCSYHSKFIVQCVIYLLIKNFTLQGQTNMSSLKEVFEGLPLDPLPPRRLRDESIAHAPVRTPNLTSDEQAVRLAIVNVIWELCIMFAGLLNFFVIK